MGFELMPHQLSAVKRMKNGCILCGDVGSGKSLTALGYYYLKQGGSIDFLTGGDYVEMRKPKDLYIITTARKRDDCEWDGELVHYLMNRRIDPLLTPYKHKIVVDSWNNIEKYTNVNNAFFIFDEQRVVGYGTWSRSFIKIAKSNEWILLSATPGDKWEDYIPVFIANGFYRNKTQFQDEHIVYSYRNKFPQVIRYINVGRLVRLRDNILIDMEFHRDIKTVHEDVYVKYSIEEYNEIKEDRWNPFTDLPIQTASELCQALRRSVNSHESRQIELLRIFEDHPKLIVFYNYDYELDILKDLYYGDGVVVAEWNGHAHQPIPDTDSWVYLVQYTAGCEGWNCIKTDTIVFFSQNYSYKVMHQAAGRINRMNTPYKTLYYYHLTTKSGIDAAIARALKSKKKFNEGRFINGKSKTKETIKRGSMDPVRIRNSYGDFISRAA